MVIGVENIKGTPSRIVYKWILSLNTDSDNRKTCLAFRSMPDATDEMARCLISRVLSGVVQEEPNTIKDCVIIVIIYSTAPMQAARLPQQTKMEAVLSFLKN